MTGRRPDTTQVWDLTTFWRDAGGNFTTIPQYFKEQGYRTAGFGKIYHPGKGGGNNDIPLSWTEPYYMEKNGLFYQVINDSWWAVPEELSVSKPLHDEGVTTAAMELLEKFAPKAQSGEEPFFVAVGFQKPHIPFVFPERYLKYYPLDDMDLAHNQYVPKNFPPIAWFHIEGSNYDDIKKTNRTGTFNQTLPDYAAILYRRAYFGCVTFVDDMVGRLLKSLEDLDLSRNTIVTFIGDHGFHLGENGMWGKHTNMEQATHAPMMIRVPGRTDEGLKSNSIVEFIDLFPTIVEAAGLDPVALCPEYSANILECSEGRSFASLLDNPRQSFKEYALSQIVRTRSMGYTLRDDRYRYVEWIPIEQQPLSENTCSRNLIWDKLYGRELYDHQLDPEENNNIVDDEMYAVVVEQMSKDMRRMVATSITARC
jgi:iduronate 2-sulfatase